jgi:hypothetical protein
MAVLLVLREIGRHKGQKGLAIMSKTIYLDDSVPKGVECVILAEKAYSKHPDDKFLTLRLVYLPDNHFTPFVVWGYNRQDKAHFLGDYCEDLSQAVRRFESRGLKD